MAVWLGVRGNARQEIVADDVDRDKRVELLQRSVEQHGWKVFGFGLLSNHYHLFLRTPEPNPKVTPPAP